MCIIVDANCLPLVFIGRNKGHEKYEPVLNWIRKGKGKLIYGGTKYLKELYRLNEVHKIINELKDQNKVIIAKTEIVDNEQKRIESIITNKAFNDPHLPAIAIVTKCHLICTEDKKCSPFVTDKRLYPKDMKPPKIYKCRQHAHLLCDRNIDNIYKK